MKHLLKKLLPLIAFLPVPLMAGGFGGAIETGISGAKIGDLGNSYGLETGYRMTPALRARLSYSTLDYANDRTFGSIGFQEKLDQKNARLALDWFPWQDRNGIFASAGVTQLGDPSTLSATVDPALNYPLNGSLYTGAQLGQISGTVETSKTVPYAGVGYQHAFGKRNGNGWYVQAEAGSVFNLSPELKMQSTNPFSIANLPGDLQAYATQESSKLEDSYAIYGVTIGYRF